MQQDTKSFSFTVLPVETGMRLDLFLVRRLGEYSRSFLLGLIRRDLVLVDGLPNKAGYRIRPDEQIAVTVPPPPPSDLDPEKVNFAVLYEDESLLVLVKPPGLVVHPAAGHRSGTLAHGLLYHYDSLPGTEQQRPGIVHRLDKDTSGVMVVARTRIALDNLSRDFHERNVTKIYHAILVRCPADGEGRIVAAIGRHQVRRQKMAIRSDGRYAATRWQVQERFQNGMCLMELNLETGRTHQIRVHMASLGCPVAGDELYGGRVPESIGLVVERQLLHASTIAFPHPLSRKPMRFTAPLWPDMAEVLDCLRGLPAAD